MKQSNSLLMFLVVFCVGVIVVVNCDGPIDKPKEVSKEPSSVDEAKKENHNEIEKGQSFIEKMMNNWNPKGFFMKLLKGLIKRILGADYRMISVHFLFKERAPNKPSEYFEDHVSVKVLEDNQKFTVKELSEFAQSERAASREAHIKFHVQMFDDPYEKKNVLYLENETKPLFDGEQKDSKDGEVDFNKKMSLMKVKHVHVYAYNPTDQIVPVSKPNSRTIELINPGIRDEKIYIRASLYDNIEDSASVKTVVTTTLQQRITTYAWMGYKNNEKITKLWYPDGTMFYDEEKIDEAIKMKGHLEKGSFEREKTLLLFNFDPTKPFPWAKKTQ